MEDRNCACELLSGLTILNRRTLTRRALLMTGAFAVFFFKQSDLATKNRTAPRAVPLGARRLTSVFQRKRSARAVGRAYLRRAPEEAHPEILVNAIWESNRDLQRVFLHGDDDRLRAAIQNCVRRDFDHNRTVVLDGWLLSHTETRLCALAELA